MYLEYVTHSVAMSKQKSARSEKLRALFELFRATIFMASLIVLSFVSLWLYSGQTPVGTRFPRFGGQKATITIAFDVLSLLLFDDSN